jgi:hypothetical protein
MSSFEDFRALNSVKALILMSFLGPIKLYTRLQPSLPISKSDTAYNNRPMKKVPIIKCVVKLLLPDVIVLYLYLLVKDINKLLS